MGRGVHTVTSKRLETASGALRVSTSSIISCFHPGAMMSLLVIFTPQCLHCVVLCKPCVVMPWYTTCFRFGLPCGSFNELHPGSTICRLGRGGLCIYVSVFREYRCGTNFSSSNYLPQYKFPLGLVPVSST